MKTEEQLRQAIASMQNLLEQTTYQPHFVAYYVERIKMLKWVLGEIEL